LVSKIKVEGSIPSYPEFFEIHFYSKKKRAYSLAVEHTAHNGKNVGSNPTILKE
jgi:hypothetical protein